MKHKHHILPKYKGGADTKANLVEVTVTQHAMFHYCNWRLWGEQGDWLAWKGLSRIIGKDEIIKHLREESRCYEKMVEKFNELKETDPAFRQTLKENALRVQPLGTEAALSPESRQKRIESFRKIGHQQGEKNSMFGTMWITNGEHNTRIKKNDPIPEGYQRGRKLN